MSGSLDRLEVVSDGADAVLDDLIESLTARLQAGESVDLDEVARRHPEHAERLRRLLPALVMMADLGESSPRELEGVVAARPGGGVLGDFRIVREIGRGGMGVVYEAEQISLARRVALKVLPFAAVLDPRQLRRFQAEAQAAAQLHHTHIVPVHFVGSERGVHYYAMQLIEGQPLSALIAGLRRPAGLAFPKGPDPGATARARESATGPSAAPSAGGAGDDRPGSPSWTTLSQEYAAGGPAFFRTAAGLGIQAAEALEHAHQLGIVHRDVKPANLLVDARGHLWVTDFGLAHVQGDLTLTATGDVVGTLRYMSPEQVLGRPAAVDHRADVYALGVTLYELLTLTTPFTAKDRHELARQIAGDEPRPPRRLNPAIPTELEVIVLKAMGKGLDERYATAQELADDLRRFLEDRPIRARRPTPAQRLRKWSRRHRTAVRSAGVSLAVSLLVAVAALATSNVAIRRERDRKEAALQEKDRALRQREDALATARANLGLARKAVDDLYTRVAEELNGRPRVQPLQRKLLLQALAFYEEFARQGGDDPEVRFEAGRAYHRAADIEILLGRLPEAERAVREAIAVFEGLSRESPAEARYRVELAGCYQELGTVLVGRGLGRQGGDAYRQAKSLMQGLVAAAPAEPDYRSRLAFAYRSLGGQPGLQLAEAEAALRDAIRLEKELVAGSPDQARFRIGLADSHYRLGSVLVAARRYEEAEASCREALRLTEPTGANPDSPDRRYVLISVRLLLGRIADETGRPADAEAEYRRAVPLAEAYAADFPDLPGSWMLRSGVHLALSDLHERAQRLGEAADDRRKALDSQERAMALVPDDPASRVVQFDSAVVLGRLLADAGRRPEARETYEKVMKLYEALWPRVAGEDTLSRARRANLHHGVTRALIALGRPREAAETARKGVVLYEGLMAEPPGESPAAPGGSKVNVRLATTSHLLGVALAATGRPEEAIAAYRSAVALYPDGAQFNNDLAWILATAPDPRLHAAAEAVGLARKAAELRPKAPNVWNTLGVALYRAGDYHGSIAALEKAEELGRGREFGFNALFLAMARWRLGERDRARSWYDRAVKWFDERKIDNDVARRFRAEAAGLLQVGERAGAGAK